MKTSRYVKTFFYIVLCGALCLMLFYHSMGSPIVLQSADSRITMSIKCVKSVEEHPSSLVVEIYNLGDHPFEYVDHRDAHGLDFVFLDSSAREIVPDPIWLNEHLPPSYDQAISVNIRSLQPNDSFSYVLELTEALPARWREIDVIRASWYHVNDKAFEPKIVGKINLLEIHNQLRQKKIFEILICSLGIVFLFSYIHQRLRKNSLSIGSEQSRCIN
jgi:hypothetical protein